MGFELSRIRLYLDRQYRSFSDHERSELLRRFQGLLGLTADEIEDVTFQSGCVLFEATIPTPAAERLAELIARATAGDISDDEIKEFSAFLRFFKIKADKFDYGLVRRVSQPASRNLVVFVHGWDGSDASFKGLVERVESKTGCDTFVYSYPTGKVTHSPAITFLSKNLDNAIRLKLSGGRKIGFIAHSMGGLVVRKLLVSQHRRAEPLDRQTGLVVFAASPSQGVTLAGLALNVPFLAKDQLADLAPNSSFMVDLQEEWAHWRKSAAVPVRAIFGTADEVVAFESAAADDPEAVPMLGRDHRNIVKVDRDDDEVAQTLCHFVKKAGL